MIKVIDIDYLRVSNDPNTATVAVLKDGRTFECGNATKYADAVVAVNNRFNKA